MKSWTVLPFDQKIPENNCPLNNSCRERFPNWQSSFFTTAVLFLFNYFSTQNSLTPNLDGDNHAVGVSQPSATVSPQPLSDFPLIENAHLDDVNDKNGAEEEVDDDDDDNEKDYTDEQNNENDEEEMVSTNGRRLSTVSNPTPDWTVVTADRFVRIAKRKLVKKRREEEPIDDFVLKRTLALLHQLALRILRTHRRQLKPNNIVLANVGYEERHINEKIVLGFSKAQARDSSMESKATTFVNFLSDPDLKNSSKNGLLTALQNFANHNYTTYRLFLFSEENGRVPEFRGKRTPAHRVPLCVYVNKDNEVFVVTDVARLFSANNTIYCPDCATSYHRYAPENHKKTCPLRCLHCCSIGYEFPCADENIEVRCAECNRIFNNHQCYKRHKEKVCKVFKCCEECSQTYIIVSGMKHECRHVLCRFCKRYHTRNVKCFI